jgi:hypothetical protein
MNLLCSLCINLKDIIMKDTNNQRGRGRQENPDELTGRGKGQQGVDKTPGEEPSQDTEHVTMETQKGKKVDADPSKESDRPIRQEGM